MKNHLGSRLLLSVLIVTMVPRLAVARQRPNYDALAEVALKAALPQKGTGALLRPEAPSRFEERLGVPTFVWPAKTHSGAPIASLGARGKVTVTSSSAPGLAENTARTHLADYAALYGLKPAELSTAKLTHIHLPAAGAVVAKFRQELNGIEVFRDTINVVMDQQGQLIALSGYITGSDSGVRFPTPASGFRLTPEDAVTRATLDLCGCPAAAQALLLEPARVKKVYFHLPDHYEPAYYLELDLGDAASTESDSYSYVISAVDGHLLFRNNLTASDSYTYRVWANTTGSRVPFDGPQGTNGTPHPTGVPDGYQPPFVAANLLTLQNGTISTNDPWLPPGSVFLTGNNVEAYADLTPPDGFNTNDVRGTASSTGSFDYLYDFNSSPTAANQMQAAITQLFYVTNFMHDWYYDFGFNEVAGNAQASNYGRGGIEADSMRVEAQDYSGRNNANMSTPSDGGRPRMQLFLYTQLGQRSVTTTLPSIAWYGAGTAIFGPSSFDVTADIVWVDDGVAGIHDGCETPFSNAAAIVGNIAFIDRGTCANGFVQKVQNAQANGAIGVIIGNISTSLNPSIAPSMGGTPATTVTIAPVSLNLADADVLRSQLAAGQVRGRLFREPLPDRDATIDNHFVAHEWAHYLSNRLIGDANGLSNVQGRGLGEGWSDFNALLMTVEQGDDVIGTNANFNGVYGQGGFAESGKNPDGTPSSSYYYGGRRVPYSTDMTRDPLTYRHTANGNGITGAPLAFGADGANNAEFHNTGEVWTSMLWECYAALLRDTLGSTPRLTFQQAQDRMKSYFVASLKATPVMPTILEARDAVLAAAKANDTADFALFSAAFAKRGAGAHAVAADRFNDTNGPVTESFTTGADVVITAVTLTDDIQSCDGDGSLDNGETGALRVTIRNAGPTTLAATSATVTSNNPSVAIANGGVINFPSTGTLQTATASVNVSLNGAVGIQTIAFTVNVTDPAISNGTVTGTFNQRANTDSATGVSATDDVEAPMSAWVSGGSPSLSAGNGWRRNTNAQNDHNWFVPDAPVLSDQTLTSPTLAVAPTGTFSFTFNQRFQFEGSLDGGVVEISSDGGVTWNDVGAANLSPTYNGTIVTGRGNPLSGRPAYVGLTTTQPGYAPTTVTLGTAFAGLNVKIRFRFGADSSGGSHGWEIDDIAFSNITNTPFTALVADPGHAPCTGATTTALSSSATTADLGQSVTLTAVVSSPVAAPGGTFTFFDGSTSVGTVALAGNQAQLSTSSLALGGHLVTAHYDGDATHQVSTSPSLTQVIRGLTTTNVTSSSNPSGLGNTVTFTATLALIAPASGTPDGPVTFRDSAAILGTVMSFGGTATFTTSALALGSHSISAAFPGASTYAPSTSATLTQTVNAPFGTPASLVATATSTTTVNVTWQPMAGVDHFEVFRKENNGPFILIAAPVTNGFADTGLTAGTTYAYEVRAVASTTISGFSNIDPATTIIFTDSPILPGVTVIKAVHLLELRQAVNAIRSCVGLAASTFTNTVTAGVPIRAADISELRSALAPARSALGLATLFVQDPLSAGSIVRATDVQEIRDAVK